jgi:hypothetical protein
LSNLFTSDVYQTLPFGLREKLTTAVTSGPNIPTTAPNLDFVLLGADFQSLALGGQFGAGAGGVGANTVVDLAATLFQSEGVVTEEDNIVLRVGRSLVEAAVPGMLSSVGHIPVMCELATTLCQFYGICSLIEETDSYTLDLKASVDDMATLLRPVIPLICVGFGQFKVAPSMAALLAVTEDCVATLRKLSHKSGALRLVEEINALRERIRDDVNVLNLDITSFKVSLDEKRRIEKYLRTPNIFSEDVIAHHRRFHAGSRGWMHERVGAWMNGGGGNDDGPAPSSSRVFWLQGASGVGKSAFAGNLCVQLVSSQRLLGSFFCRFDDETRTTPSALILSLAAQCSYYLPAAKKEFMHMFKRPKQRMGPPMDANQLFDYLLKDPLVAYTASLRESSSGKNNCGSAGTSPAYSYAVISNSSKMFEQPNMVLVIDGLDEAGATPCERQALLSLLRTRLPELPSWVKVFVTSRVEEDISRALECHEPECILESDPRLVEDIREYAEFILTPKTLPMELAGGVDLVMERCSDKFIYAALMADALQGQTHLDQDDLDELLPEGLPSFYRVVFSRIKYQDAAFYDSFVVKLLRLIVAAPEPLPLLTATIVLDAEPTSYEMLHAVGLLKSLFPLKPDDPSVDLCDKYFLPIHKSVVEWLLDEHESGANCHVREKPAVASAGAAAEMRSPDRRRNSRAPPPALSLLHAEADDEQKSGGGTDDGSGGGGSEYDNHASDVFHVAAADGHAMFTDCFNAKLRYDWLRGGDDVDEYFYRHGLRHLVRGNAVNAAVALCFRLPYLQSALASVGIVSLIENLRWLTTQEFAAKQKKPLLLLVQLLVLASPALQVRDKEEVSGLLCTQLLGRLYRDVLRQFVELRELHEEACNWQYASSRVFWLAPVKATLVPPGDGPAEVDPLITAPEVIATRINCTFLLFCCLFPYSVYFSFSFLVLNALILICVGSGYSVWHSWYADQPRRDICWKRHTHHTHLELGDRLV